MSSVRHTRRTVKSQKTASKASVADRKLPQTVNQSAAFARCVHQLAGLGENALAGIAAAIPQIRKTMPPTWNDILTPPPESLSPSTTATVIEHMSLPAVDVDRNTEQLRLDDCINLIARIKTTGGRCLAVNELDTFTQRLVSKIVIAESAAFIGQHRALIDANTPPNAPALPGVFIYIDAKCDRRNGHIGARWQLPGGWEFQAVYGEGFTWSSPESISYNLSATGAKTHDDHDTDTDNVPGWEPARLTTAA